MTEPMPSSSVGWVDQILTDAIAKQASDIHLEPHESHTRIRFRIDGLLTEQKIIPKAHADGVNARVKILAGLDIGQQRLPQDGRLRHAINAGGGWEEFRVSSCPTAFGEKLVLRHLERLDALPRIESLGLSEAQCHQLRHAIVQPWGLVLVTGPTGSGKTTTLYSVLSELNQPHRNIQTIEDPIEMGLPGINQVQCHDSIGLSFPRALRAFLRQDPDVLMIGEIRDAETAKIAVEAAQTGHLVFSTLHTNTAQASLARLRHLGIPWHDLASGLKLIVAQTLMRVLHDCKVIDDSTEARQLSLSAQRPIYRAVGCSHCRSGYLGRIGVFETLPIDVEETEKGSFQGPNHTRSSGLRASALMHVNSGRSSLLEMKRVILQAQAFERLTANPSPDEDIG